MEITLNKLQDLIRSKEYTDSMLMNMTGLSPATITITRNKMIVQEEIDKQYRKAMKGTRELSKHKEEQYNLFVMKYLEVQEQLQMLKSAPLEAIFTTEDI